MTGLLCMHGKRGDVAFVLVVVVTIAAILSAGMVMVTTQREFVKQTGEMSRLSSDAATLESYAIAVSAMVGSSEIRAGGKNETLAERFMAKSREQESLLAGSRGFYERVTAPEAVQFISTNEGYSLHISAIPIIIVREGHKMQRIMNLQINFDGQGRVHKVYKEYST